MTPRPPTIAERRDASRVAGSRGNSWRGSLVLGASVCLHIGLFGGLGLRAAPPPEVRSVIAASDGPTLDTVNGQLLSGDARSLQEETLIPVSVQGPSPTPDVPAVQNASNEEQTAEPAPAAPSPKPQPTEPVRAEPQLDKPQTAEARAHDRARPSVPQETPDPAPPVLPTEAVLPTESAPSSDVDATGEDWLRIEDQLDTEAESSARAPAVQSPAKSGSAQDPLLQRLLAAEARKAKERELTSSAASAPSHQATPHVERAGSTPPKHPTEGRLLETLAYEFSHVAGIDAGWDDVALGELRAQVRLEFEGGKLQSWTLSGQSSPQLTKALRSTLFYAKRGKYFGSERTPLEGRLTLGIRVELSRVRADAVRGGLVTYERLTDAAGRYLPIAYAVRPSLRKILVEVERR